MTSRDPRLEGHDPSSRLFDRSLGGFFRDAARISWHEPRKAVFFAGLGGKQRRAAARRRSWEKAGLHVPPLMIISVTRQCNLRCAGCFVHAQARPPGRR